MQASVNPSFLKGSVQVPASKSMMQRVCAAALLHHGKTTVHNPGHSNDDKAALQIIQQLGADVNMLQDSIEIISNGIHARTDIIDCGESGLAARMFIPIIALSDKRLTVTGSGTLMNRPMDVLDELLPHLGVATRSNNGYLPFDITGPLKACDIIVDGSVSSQFLTGLLFAFSYAARNRAKIHVNNLKSKPYIDMTLEVLELFGKTVKQVNYEDFIIDPSGFTKKTNVAVSIEADWSSAAFWLVAGAVNGDLNLAGLNIKSTQADKAILNVLKEAGASIDIGREGIKVSRTQALDAFCYNATDTPDLFPILAVLAAFCKGESCIKGTHRLLHKESNRLESISQMLHNFGIVFSAKGDELIIEGGHTLQCCEIDSFDDHRIAMAAAVAALGAEGPVIIHAAGAVSKSYPDFFSDLSLLGGKVTINNNDR